MEQVKPRAATAFLVLAALVAALVPLAKKTSARALAAERDFPGWPAQYEGRELMQLPLTPREDAFVRDLPGKVGRFSDGRREIIIRWVGAPTRLLHPAADCLRGSGYNVTPLPVRRDATGSAMSCVRAARAGDAAKICEVIRDERGQSWPDASSWYWHALFGATPPPWWAFVVAEAE